MSSVTWMRAAGLFNVEAPDLRDLITEEEKSVLRAYCTSQRCLKGKKSKAKLPKSVSVQAKECPDCGHALLWKRERA